MSPARSSKTSSPDTRTFDAELCAHVERLIGEQVAQHERLIEALGEHRAALTGADTDRLSASLRRVGELLEGIGALEDQRRAALGETDSPATRTRITELAAMIDDEPRRTRLLDLGARLASLVERARREQDALRDAAASLATHMEGLIRQVAAKLSNTGAYGRDGRVGKTAAVVSALDVKQ